MKENPKSNACSRQSLQYMLLLSLRTCISSVMFSLTSDPNIKPLRSKTAAAGQPHNSGSVGCRRQSLGMFVYPACAGLHSQ
jgi:hypothetical protein